MNLFNSLSKLVSKYIATPTPVMIFLLPKVVFLVLYINIQSSWQLESLLDLGPGPFDGLDVEEEVIESFQEHP